MNATPQLNEAAEGGSSPRSCSRSSIVDFIRRHNRWRRGDESLTMESPKAIGEALDTVCDTLDRHANEIQGWQNRWECGVERAARAEARLDAIHQLAASALQTSWLYSGKEHVEKLMREIAAISSENANIQP